MSRELKFYSKLMAEYAVDFDKKHEETKIKFLSEQMKAIFEQMHKKQLKEMNDKIQELQEQRDTLVDDLDELDHEMISLLKENERLKSELNDEKN